MSANFPAVDFPESISLGAVSLPAPRWELAQDTGLAAAQVRFARSCRFDAGTGCVVWIGGRTTGGGHSRPYGAFKYQGRRWGAHRWAARFIHGFDIEGRQVDHCCPPEVRDMPDTLCMAHLQAISPAANRELQTLRARAAQTVGQRRFWAHVACGLEPEPDTPADDRFTQMPFYVAPQWLTVCHAHDEKPASHGASGFEGGAALMVAAR